MKKRQIIILCLCLTSCFPAQAQSDLNVIPFQGQLASQAGQPLFPSNALTLVFRLYSAPVGGMAMWEESQPSVSVNAGRFSVLLGSRTALPAAPTFNATLYLGITVDDGNPATVDVEMRPRQALVPVISASYARSADKLAGYDWTSIFGANSPTNPIPAAKLADGSLPGTKLQPLSITSNQIAPHTITAAQILNSTITPAQIVPASLTLSALAKEVLDQLAPAGSITAFGGNTNAISDLDGWLFCDGRPLSSTVYGRLYSKISTNWGAGIPGSTNDFNLPDLRGYFLRGVSSGTLRDPDRLLRTAMNPGGNIADAVGSIQPGQIGPHTHPYTGWNASFVSGGSGGLGAGSAVNFSTRSTSQNTGTETRPINAYVNYLIKY